MCLNFGHVWTLDWKTNIWNEDRLYVCFVANINLIIFFISDSINGPHHLIYGFLMYFDITHNRAKNEKNSAKIDYVESMALTDGPFNKCVIKKLLCYSFEFNENWWSFSYLWVLKLCQVSLKSNEKQKGFYYDTFNGWYVC